MLAGLGMCIESEWDSIDEWLQVNSEGRGHGEDSLQREARHEEL